MVLPLTQLRLPEHIDFGEGDIDKDLLYGYS